jgi:hypothetical protein
MRRREFIPAILALFFPGSKSKRGETAPGPDRLRQDEKDRPVFFASQVLSFQDVVNPERVLGEPDDQYAEILAGGQMTFLMEDRIYPSLASDDGIVVCNEDTRYGLAGWFPVGAPEEPRKYAWMPMGSGVSPSGFRVSTLYPDSGSPGVNMLKIINNDSKSLFIDGVAGYGHEPEGRR